MLVLGTAAAFPDERDDVLEWLGLRSVEVERVPALPADARRAPLADLGTSVDLGEARRLAGFAALLPRALGGPEAVRVRDGRVSLIYEDGRLLVTELRGALDRSLLRKLVGPGTVVRDTPDGVFFGGRDHVVLFKDASGAVVQDRPRLAGPTFLTQRGDVLVRIEGRGLTEARAREIARSLRP